MSGGTAYAHGFVGGASFLNGALHPLLVPAHALSLLAFGLMTGQQVYRVLLAILFPATLVAGILMIVSAAFPLEFVPVLLLACAAAAGLLTALARPLLAIVPAAILAIGGLSLIFDSVPSVVSKRDTILALCATALAATLV
ncbi:MAG: HupE/UreJ family protein, partial [Pseudorhodoplanes sp.]|nr:HupE/UreJ family protein [Pseudorhodoplanes sp.]